MLRSFWPIDTTYLFADTDSRDELAADDADRVAPGAALRFEVILARFAPRGPADGNLRVVRVEVADPAPFRQLRGFRLLQPPDRFRAHCLPPCSRLAPAGPHRLATVDEPGWRALSASLDAEATVNACQELQAHGRSGSALAARPAGRRAPHVTSADPQRALLEVCRSCPANETQPVASSSGRRAAEGATGELRRRSETSTCARGPHPRERCEDRGACFGSPRRPTREPER